MSMLIRVCLHKILLPCLFAWDIYVNREPDSCLICRDTSRVAKEGGILYWEIEIRSWIYRGLFLSFQASSDTRWEALSTIQAEKENLQPLLRRDLCISGRQPAYFFFAK